MKFKKNKSGFTKKNQGSEFKKTGKTSEKVSAKKHLGQHFLENLSIAQQIVESLTGYDNYTQAIEIGPGMGVLTQFLIQNKKFKTYAIDVDVESVAYLKTHFPNFEKQMIFGDFLRTDIPKLVNNTSFAVIGNFPYNISTEILFKILDYKDLVPEVVGMFQKEVAERISAKPGNKSYGITSVLLQAYYSIEYLFTVHENEFNPPPKVKSGVIRMKRNTTKKLNCNEQFFKTIVKTAFNQRRKMLSNSLKAYISDNQKELDIFKLRPENLSVDQFVELTNMLETKA